MPDDSLKTMRMHDGMAGRTEPDHVLVLCVIGVMSVESSSLLAAAATAGTNDPSGHDAISNGSTSLVPAVTKQLLGPLARHSQPLSEKCRRRNNFLDGCY